MKRWLISYVLYAPGVEHLDFVNALQNERATRIMPSHWILESGRSAVELRDQFAALLAASDHLLVAELGQEIVWGTNEERTSR